MDKGAIEEREVEAVLSGSDFSQQEADAIRRMRRELRKRGVTREPLLSCMACEFAELLLASRRRGKGPEGTK